MTTPDLEALSQPYLPNASSSREVDITKSMAQVFLTAVVAAKILDWSGLGQRWSRSGFNTGDFDVQISGHFKEAFKVGMSVLLAEAAIYGISKKGVDVKVEDKVIQDWSITYAAQIAEQVANQSTMAVREIVNAGLNQRLPAQALADRAQAAYGLDPRSANTYQAYMSSKTLPKNSTPIDEVSALLVQRAMTIGDVNTFTGINFGVQLSLMSALGHGILPTDARKVWLTALDERVCPTCGPMDGVAVPVNEVFTILMPLPKTARGKNRKSVDAIVPPIHPNCRCTIVLEDEFLGGLITRTARYDADANHLARLFSEPEDLVVQKFWESNKHPRDGKGRFAERWGNMSSGQRTTAVYMGGAVGIASGAMIADISNHLVKMIKGTTEGKSWWDVKYPTYTYYKAPVELPPKPTLAKETLNSLAARMNLLPEFSLGGSNLIEQTFKNRDEVAYLKHLSEDIRQWTGVYRFKSGGFSLGKYETLTEMVENAPVSEETIYRGIKGKTSDPKLKKALEELTGKLSLVGEEVELPLASWTKNTETAKIFADDIHKSGIILQVKGARALNISPMSHHAEAEWLTTGHFKVVSVEAKDARMGGRLLVTLVQVAHVVKAMPLNLIYRDRLGRFAAAGAGVAAIGAGAKGAHYMAVEAPIAGRTRPELNSRLQKTDQRIKHLQTGTYMLPRSYLDAHRRAWGFRIGQDAHVDALAAKIKEEGFKRPITLHVYNDQSVIWDGQHRLEAAYRLGRSRIPVRVVRRHEDFDPFQEGLLGLIEERRTRRLRQEIARRPNQNVGSLKIGQTPRQRISNNVNRVFIARGEGQTD
jgi:hypothetical protein